MTLSESFTVLFSELNSISVSLWICGIVLIVIEFYQNCRGVSAILGTLCSIAACVVAVITTGSIGASFVFVFLTVIILYSAHVLMLATQKYRWLKTAAGKKSGHTREYMHLINREGIATTEINPTGHIAVGDTNLFVSSVAAIEKGETVKIVTVADDKIIVKRADSVIDILIDNEDKF